MTKWTATGVPALHLSDLLANGDSLARQQAGGTFRQAAWGSGWSARHFD